MSLPSSNLFKRLRGLNQAALLTAFLFIAAPVSNAWAVCSNPAGNAGDIIYNGDENLLSYCDGTNWIGVRGTGKTNSFTASSSGLIGHWKMEETSGSTIFDQTGNNNGTWSDNTDSVITTESVTGTDNNALDFEIGDDAYIVINAGAGSTDLDNIAPMSVCAWVNFESLPGAGGPIVGKTGGASFGNAGWLLGYNDAGGQRFFFESNLGDGFQTDFNTTNLGTFQHVCATWDGTDGTAGINIYLDSVLDNNSAFTDTRTADDATYDLEICADDSSSTQCDGIIDDVRIYNRVLTATEISNIYQATGGSQRSLIGHWKLDETSGSTITDSSASGYDATWSDFTGNDVTEESNAGKVNSSIHFDGTDDRITVADANVLEGMAEISVSAWVYMDAQPANSLFYTIASKGTLGVGDVTSYVMWLRGPSGTNPGFFWSVRGSSSTSAGCNFTTMPSAGEWHHLSGTYDGTTARAYIDGVEVCSGSGNIGTILDTTARFRIGAADRGASDHYMDGRIDDVRVYNRALSTSEIQSLAAACQEGSMIYNSDKHVPQYCAGNDDWIAMGPVRDGIDSGLVGHWKLDETSGTTAGDSSGNLLNGSMQGGLDATSDSADGKIGTSLVFDGVDDGIQIANSPSLENFTAFSLSAWVYPTASAQGSGSRVISKPDGGSGDNYNLGFGNTGTSWFRIETDGDNQTEILGNALPLNEWTHITGTWDSKNMRLYENGVEVSASPVAKTGIIDADGSPLSIGTHTNSPADRRFPGRIDDARVYDRVLSEAEITALYELGNNEDSSLVGHWTLDDLSGTTAADSSGTGNIGTLTNFDTPPAWTSSGIVDSSLIFDGTDDRILVPHDASIAFRNVTLTLATWFHLDSAMTNGEIQTFFIKNGSAGYNPRFELYYSNATDYIVRFIPSSGGAGVRSSSTIATDITGEWHHAAITFDPTSGAYQFYIDGVADTSGTVGTPGGYANGAGNLIIGANSSSTFFDGRLDDMRMYTRVLSATEINAIHKLGIGNCSNPAGKEGDVIMGDLDPGAGVDNALMYCDGINWQAVGKTP